MNYVVLAKNNTPSVGYPWHEVARFPAECDAYRYIVDNHIDNDTFTYEVVPVTSHEEKQAMKTILGIRDEFRVEQTTSAHYVIFYQGQSYVAHAPEDVGNFVTQLLYSKMQLPDNKTREGS